MITVFDLREQLVSGECHHIARYHSYPDMVFYYDDSELTGEQAQVIEDYLYRRA